MIVPLLLNSVYGSCNDVVLRLAGQRIKEGTVAGHTDHEITVFLRLLLCGQHGLPGDDVILDMEAMQRIKEGADNGYQLRHIVLILKHALVHFLIQQQFQYRKFL